MGTAKKQLEELLFLKESGYAIPEALIEMAQQTEAEHRGVKQIWECKKCPDFSLETFVFVSAGACPQDHPLHLKWKSQIEQDSELASS